MRVLIVPDKFKGTLSAGEAAAAIARGWRKARPSDAVEMLPLSDGGDGFGQVISDLLGAKVRKIQSLDAAHRTCAANWWWEPKTGTAIIESAAVIGLAKLAECAPKAFGAGLHGGITGSRRPGGLRSGSSAAFHPFYLDTFGLGALVRAAAERGATCCLLGIGGSATNDGGFGLARALGWGFLDGAGNEIEGWTALEKLNQIRAPRRRRWFRKLLVAVDVQNPLLGRRGASRIYGPQKGLRTEDFGLAERCLRRLALVVRRDLGRDCAKVPGAGAAGGLGFGLATFLGGELAPGFDLFAGLAGLESRLGEADVVITGEGSLDDSTLMGKGVGQLAKGCRHLRVPCIGLAGGVKLSTANRRAFAQTYSLTEITNVTSARANPGFWLEQVARKAAMQWPSGRC
jgi:glycerate kinase